MKNVDQLITRSDQLLQEILELMDSSVDVEAFHSLLTEHQQIMQLLVEQVGEQSIVLQARYDKLQQVYLTFSQAKEQIEQEMGVISQTQRLAKTYNPQR
ncbi:MAG: hypothetical protein CENE_00357 [Candidatus Celerinatantimonas neptuna]|nr:MAG: hypothetical protein CENE_00357 [Candidatus Celerinatantimonas neptuna]